MCYTESKPNPLKIDYYWVLEIDLKKIEISCLEFDDCIIPAHASFKPYRVYSKKASGKSKRKYVSSYFDNLNSFNKGEWEGWYSYPFDIENELYTSELDNDLMIHIYKIARHYEGGVDVRLEILSLDSKTEFFGIKVDSQKDDYLPFIQKAEVREVGGPTWYVMDPAKIQFPQIFGCDSITKVSLRFESRDELDQLRVLQFDLIHKNVTDIVNELKNNFGQTTFSGFSVPDYYVWEGKEILIYLTSLRSLTSENDYITISFLFE